MNPYPWHKKTLLGLLAGRTELAHALLLRGPLGIGKLALAEALAQALLCESPSAAGEACGRCTACAWMEQGGHPDVRRLEPDSLAKPAGAEPDAEKKEKASAQIPVEQVRAIADFVNVTSHRGGRKIVLVHPAEALNVNAANALLKSLEEPPPQTFFILVAHRWHQLLPTVKSRCRHIVLPPPAPEAARAWLAEQNVRNPDLALAHAGGAPLVAASFDEDYWRQREGFLKSIAAKDMRPLAVAEGLGDTAPALVAGWLQKWSYDILCQVAGGTVRYNPDFAPALRALAARTDAVQAARFLRRMVRVQRIVPHPLNPRLFLEDLLLSYAAFAAGRPLEMAA